MLRRRGSQPPRPASRPEGRDLLVVAVGLVSALVYALHGFQGPLTRDLGLYSYAGQQVADGVPPYLGLLNRAGPLAHVLPGTGVLLARLGGFDDVVTMRVLFFLIATATVCAVYLLGRDLFGSRRAGTVTAAALLSVHGFIHYASNGPREKTPMTLFIVLALWAATRRRWFTAGVCTSLATLCLQTAFFSTFTAVAVAAVLLAGGQRLQALGRVALGGLTPVAVLGVWFALAGSLRESWDAFFVINRRYTESDPLGQNLGAVWLDLHEAYGVTVWIVLGGMVALVVRSLVPSGGRERESDLATPVLPAMTAGLVAGLAWTLKDYDSWADLFTVLPFAAVGVGGAFALAEPRLSRRTATGVASVLAVGAVVLGVTFSVTTRDDTLVAQQRAVDAVLGQLPPGATMTSIEAPQPLVLASRTNPTRYQMFRGGLEDYMEDTWPGGLAGFQRDLVSERTDLVAVGDRTSDEWRAAIEPDYVDVGSAPGWTWYARASLGEARLADLREATGHA